MKSLITVLLILILTGCGEILETKNNKPDSGELVSSGNFQNLEDSKAAVDTIFKYVELAEGKYITKKEADRVAMPMQKYLDSLAPFLTAYEADSLKKYKLAVINAMVKRKTND